MNVNLYSLGLMSGTSLDGIDLSIIKSDGEQYLEIIDNLYLKYDDKLKLKLKRIIDLCTSKDQLAKNIKEIKQIVNILIHARVESVYNSSSTDPPTR